MKKVFESPTIKKGEFSIFKFGLEIEAFRKLSVSFRIEGERDEMNLGRKVGQGKNMVKSF